MTISNHLNIGNLECKPFVVSKLRYAGGGGDAGPIGDICWPFPLAGSFCFSSCVVIASTSARVESS